MVPVMRTRSMLLIALYIVLVFGGWYVGRQIDMFAQIEILPQNEFALHRMVMLATLLFIVAAAIPFVPGAEIGIAMLLIFGARIAMLVYLSMILALSLSFFLGRLLPLSRVEGLLSRLGLPRSAARIAAISHLSPVEIRHYVEAHAPRKWTPTLLKYRYLGLLLLMNVPGNSALGGGGGIAFIAGASRLFTIPGFLASLVVAVAPIPLYVTLADRLT